MVYDLSIDPHEDSNLWWTDLTNAWMLVPVFKRIIECERSVEQYPNIKVGEDFTGDRKWATPATPPATRSATGSRSARADVRRRVSESA